VARIGHILGIWMDSYEPEQSESDKVTLNVYYLATAVGAAEPTTDPNEVSEIRWFAADALPEELAFPGHLPEVLRVWRASRARARKPPLRRLREHSA
jgi:isopentenyldiphosphate isomerase